MMKRFWWIALMVVLLAACAGGPAQPPVSTGGPPTEAVVTPEVVATTEVVTTEAPAPDATESPVEGAATIAWVGLDGNLWLSEGEGPAQQVTADANAPSTESGEAVVQYMRLAMSSDGRLLAYTRMVGGPQGDGFQYAFELLVWDRQTGESVQAAAEMPHGLDWKPGTHLLAYGQGVDESYWAAQGKPAPDLAKGIQFFNYDTGETGELVAPEQGFHLGAPQWSPDGRFLAFDEVLYMEGRGDFAYYDFETQEYVRRDEPIGTYDWSPDGSELVYDTQTYTPIGDEAIWISARNGENARQISPEGETELSYAFGPVFSPDGNQVAYFTVPGGPDAMERVLMVQPVNEGEPRELGKFEQSYTLSWLPDGESLVLISGPFETRQVMEVSVADGTVRVVGDGGEVVVP